MDYITEIIILRYLEAQTYVEWKGCFTLLSDGHLNTSYCLYIKYFASDLNTLLFNLKVQLYYLWKSYPGKQIL